MPQFLTEDSQFLGQNGKTVLGFAPPMLPLRWTQRKKGIEFEQAVSQSEEVAQTK